jgi:SAM-dependent methyltransferase
MTIDIRLEAARFYDRNPATPDDIPFYQSLIPAPDCSILELGCGTGRVTLPLVPFCHDIVGIDNSAAMLSICRQKLAAARIPPSKAQVTEGDITGFDLGRRFDFIIAPFRVLQNLETDAEVDGLFHCIHQHLAPQGTCILNVFQPMYDPETLRQKWVMPGEKMEWEAPVEGGTIVCSSRRSRMDPENDVLYPELVYRTFVAGQLAEEVVLKLVMRCYYPDTFERLIQDHGFVIQNRWGGYSGEAYGQGSELVIRFSE